MKGFCPLASGSKGNCLYVGTEHTKILVDAGISAKSIKERLQRLHVDLADIDAVLISHEHTDHIQGLSVLAFKLGIPVLANYETARAIAEQFDECPKFKIFTTGEPFTFGDIEIQPFPVPHDAREPVAFTLGINRLKLGICTDLGLATSLVSHHLSGCHLLYVEANHDPDMLRASMRPESHKKRVLSDSGHLSNEACGHLLARVFHDALQHVYLAHLSRECNTPSTAIATVQRVLQGKKLSLPLTIALQEEMSPVTPF